jgi:hypothetical protein
VNIHKNFVRIPFVLTLSFFGLQILINFLSRYGTKILIISATILFLVSVFFYSIAMKTARRNKEILTAAFSAILLYFAIFETPFAIEVASHGTILSLFIIFLLGFLMFQGGEFRRIFFNMILLLLFLVGFIIRLSSNYFYLASVLILAVLLGGFLYIKVRDSGYSERINYYAAGFGFAVIIAIQSIIRMTNVLQ